MNSDILDQAVKAFETSVKGFANKTQGQPLLTSSETIFLKDFLDALSKKERGFFADNRGVLTNNFSGSLEKLVGYTALPADLQVVVWRVRTKLLGEDATPEYDFMTQAMQTAITAQEYSVRVAAWQFLATAYEQCKTLVLLAVQQLPQVNSFITNTARSITQEGKGKGASPAAKGGKPAAEQVASVADTLRAALVASGAMAIRAPLKDDSRDKLHAMTQTLLAHLEQARDKNDLGRMEALAALFSIFKHHTSLYTPEKAGQFLNAVVGGQSDKGKDLREAYWKGMRSLLGIIGVAESAAVVTRASAPRRGKAASQPQPDPEQALQAKWATHIKAVVAVVEGNLTPDELGLALPVLKELVERCPQAAQQAFAELVGDRARHPKPQDRLSERRISSIEAMVRGNMEMVDGDLVEDLTQLVMGAARQSAIPVLGCVLALRPELAPVALDIVCNASDAFAKAPVMSDLLPSPAHQGMLTVYRWVAESVQPKDISLLTHDVIAHVMTGLTHKEATVQQEALQALHAIAMRRDLGAACAGLTQDSLAKPDIPTTALLFRLQSEIMGRHKPAPNVQQGWVKAAQDVVAGAASMTAARSEVIQDRNSMIASALDLLDAVVRQGAEQPKQAALQGLATAVARTDYPEAIQNMVHRTYWGLCQDGACRPTGTAALAVVARALTIGL